MCFSSCPSNYFHLILSCVSASPPSSFPSRTGTRRRNDRRKKHRGAIRMVNLQNSGINYNSLHFSVERKSRSTYGIQSQFDVNKWCIYKHILTINFNKLFRYKPSSFHPFFFLFSSGYGIVYVNDTVNTEIHRGGWQVQKRKAYTMTFQSTSFSNTLRD